MMTTTTLSPCPRCRGILVYGPVVDGIGRTYDTTRCIICGHEDHGDPLPVVQERSAEVPIEPDYANTARDIEDVRNELDERNERIRALRRKGLPLGELKRAFNISGRTLHRILSAAPVTPGQMCVGGTGLNRERRQRSVYRYRVSGTCPRCGKRVRLQPSKDYVTEPHTVPTGPLRDR